MRNAFAAELTAIAAEEPRLVFLSGDIGNKLFDPFKLKFRERFFNCGVAEANMIGMAAGLAMCGMRPIAYTITPFITSRCYEQIKVDVCYHEAPVVIVGVGAGLSYASLGPTHHSFEDIAIMRALPGMTVVCPGDPLEVRAALRAAVRHPGPIYLRLGIKGEPTVHAAPPPFEIGRGISVRAGEDVCLLATGNMLATAVDTAGALGGQGIGARVVSVHTVKPLDLPLLEEVFAAYPLVVTLEEHSRVGGFGAAVAEWLADRGPARARLHRVAMRDEFMHEAGGQRHARALFGLSADEVARAVKERLAP